MMQEELAAGFFVDTLDEVFDELVDVPLAVSAVAETIILEGKSELVDEFLEELGTMLKVRGERRFVFYPKIIESSETYQSGGRRERWGGDCSDAGCRGGRGGGIPSGLRSSSQLTTRASKSGRFLPKKGCGRRRSRFG